MTEVTFLEGLTKEYKALYDERNVILTFDTFMEMVEEDPRRFIRNSPQYLSDTFDYFGRSSEEDTGIKGIERFNLLDIGTERNGKVIGAESVQSEIYDILQTFVRQGFPTKLILLHGPNGSAKSSTVETLGNAMRVYSKADEGAVYKFNWVFPSDKSMTPNKGGESATIGFSRRDDDNTRFKKSFALLEDSKIASRVSSEFRENPIFLIPVEQREKWLRDLIGKKEGIDPADVLLPKHVLMPGLSKRNQEIFESLLNAYNGNISDVFKHVQVERFFFSRQYRVGLSTVEPQMSVDAREKQLTLDKNISNLPSVLSTINFHQSQGELVEANRGILEFSDLLKRPIEAFKYLLSTIEKCSVSLPTGVVNLDLIFIATSNEKHLDAFKSSPDFGSFKGRFELVTVPYLLRPSLEKQIYSSDINILEKSMKIAPHTLDMLCTWGVMTRMKQPDPEQYPKEVKDLIEKITPRLKVKLYEGDSLQPELSLDEEKEINQFAKKILNESKGIVVYEGRFGASPREIRMVLQKASRNRKNKSITPMDIFSELESLIRDKTVYEFLQFEPRAEYHDAPLFVKVLKKEFAHIFEQEAIQSMTLVEDLEYENLLKRYVNNVVAEIKKEKLWDESTSSHVEPSKTIMEDIEKILGINKSDVSKFRESFLSRIAAYKLENPSEEINVSKVFYDFLQKIKDHFYSKKKVLIEQNFKNILLLGTNQEKNLDKKEVESAKSTINELVNRFNYDEKSAKDCLKFTLKNR